MAHTLIVDIGKTNAKLHLLDQNSRSLYREQCENPVQNAAPYPHFESEALWQWFLSRIKALDKSLKRKIISICVTTHGATAALVDSQAPAHQALVLPILDYEFAGVEALASEYAPYRPAFSQSLSPKLPAGLNLGLQLFWLQRKFPEQFAKASHILMYPQYWAWRLSGVMSSEVSSLGCHSDLWNSRDQCYSSLADRCGWDAMLPPIRSAWDALGPVLPAVTQQTGLSAACQVQVGVHDSNASYLRYLSREDEFCVFSTGTWTIAMTSACDLARLDSRRDMLGNTAVNGEAVACSRFMGGREYALICQRIGAAAQGEGLIDAEALTTVLDQPCFALPNFCPGSGPYPAAKAQIIGRVHGTQGAALATLYCALMMDVQADLLAAKGDIVIEGAFLKNRWLCEIFAALRSQQAVYLSADDTGTVRGCAQLAAWPGKNKPLDLLRCPKAELPALHSYRQRWRELVAAGGA